MTRRKITIFVIGVLAGAIAWGYGDWLIGPKIASWQEKRAQKLQQKEQQEASGLVIDVEPGTGPDHEAQDVVTYTVSEGDIPASIFAAHGGFSANDTAALLAAAEDVYDLTQVKIGQNFRFFFNGQEKAERLEYERDTERMIVAERDGESFSVRQEEIDYAVENVTARGTIENFLYVDALSAGLSEGTVIELSDIFAWDVDFTTEIRVGDEFHTIFEKRTRDGAAAPDGRILAAKFVNDGQEFFGYYFEHNGRGRYYDEEGRLLQRQFLKAPLSYRRITSGFTGARLHPITRTVMAHYQIDYAAPTGTPVVATGDGVVASAGWEGGWGRIVRMRHEGGYTTHYAHLSEFAAGIRGGSRVQAGQVIGFVGSTGWSTGPHLDYGMRLNGAPVNPLSLKLPKGNPLPADAMPDFEQIKNQFSEELAQ